mmetsp:Transcript_21888/g.37266  ORF Transcript_21888/g.37266 Transcript_21888/m.37266 type:complete len:100 (-) Transcript_21888:19-318(-)
MSTPFRARSVYRKLLRASKSWPHADEKPYIYSQLQRFRENKHLKGKDLEEALKDAELRIGVAEHYGIAYQRPDHMIDETRDFTKKSHPLSKSNSSSSFD